jgi:threonine aldolase
MRKARQIRKSVGGGMRQIGLIGAAGIYAFDSIIP